VKHVKDVGDLELDYAMSHAATPGDDNGRDPAGLPWWIKPEHSFNTFPRALPDVSTGTPVLGFDW